jgi:hypothetical protein
MDETIDQVISSITEKPIVSSNDCITFTNIDLVKRMIDDDDDESKKESVACAM